MILLTFLFFPSLHYCHPLCFVLLPRAHLGLMQVLNKVLIEQMELLITIFCLFYSYMLQTPIVLEQVSAFLEHPHYAIFVLLAQIPGLTIKFKQSINAATHVPVSRNRVLLCCVPSRDTPRGYLPTWYSAECKPTLRPQHFLPLN